VTIFLRAGFRIGDILSKKTKEELSQGKRWFQILIILGLIGGAFGAFVLNNTIMFSFLFIVIVASRSLKKDSTS